MYQQIKVGPHITIPRGTRLKYCLYIVTIVLYQKVKVGPHITIPRGTRLKYCLYIVTIVFYQQVKVGPDITIPRGTRLKSTPSDEDEDDFGEDLPEADQGTSK